MNFSLILQIDQIESFMTQVYNFQTGYEPNLWENIPSES
jgi:hypothetical protein